MLVHRGAFESTHSAPLFNSEGSIVFASYTRTSPLAQMGLGCFHVGSKHVVLQSKTARRGCGKKSTPFWWKKRGPHKSLDTM